MMSQYPDYVVDYYFTSQNLEPAIYGCALLCNYSHYKAIRIEYYDCMHFCHNYPSHKMHFNLMVPSDRQQQTNVFSILTLRLQFSLHFPACSYHRFEGRVAQLV